jgi:hypothetical protein
MCMNRTFPDHLILLAVVAIGVGVGLPGHLKVADRLAAMGVEVTWLVHLRFFPIVAGTVVVFFALLGLLPGLAAWAVERLLRR